MSHLVDVTHPQPTRAFYCLGHVGEAEVYERAADVSRSYSYRRRDDQNHYKIGVLTGVTADNDSDQRANDLRQQRKNLPMAASNSRRACLSLTYPELAFIQKLLKAEYHFITDKEQKTRQAFGRKFSDITLAGRPKGWRGALPEPSRDFVSSKANQDFLQLLDACRA